MEFTLLAALLVGLLGGVHCVGMCGGIVSALTLSADPSRPATRRLGILLLYNLGRISSYTLFGLIAGALSQFSATLLVNVHLFQTGLQGIAVLFMVAMGLYLGGWWQGLLLLERLGQHVWRRIEPHARQLLPIRSYPHAFLVGMVWGWLPCGLVYSVVFYAMSSASALHGALLMGCFGLGTLPTLVASGLLANSLLRWLRHPWVRQGAGLLVISFALLMVYRLIQ
jgi:uncharacterized protein